MQLTGLKQFAKRAQNEGFRLALMAGATAFVLMLGAGPAAGCADKVDFNRPITLVHPEVASRGLTLAQDDDSDESELPPAELEKYVAIYRDMQKDRSLTVEQAAAKEGLSLSAFRDLEGKVERDDAAREHVRDELQQSAAEASGEKPQATSTK